MTILDSKQNIPQVDIDGNVIGQDTSPFFGVSNLSYNVTLAYDRKPVGVRLSYVWRKNFLSNNEARLFANPIGVWRVPEQSLDLQVTLDVTKRLGIPFDAPHPTNTAPQTEYKYHNP